MTSVQSARLADVCVLGAGPHGLAAAVHLRQARPDCRVLVVDAEGGWLANWHRQFERARISSLRSPAVHHPVPGARALQAYLNEKRLPDSGLPYGQPTTESFASFCAQAIEDFELDDPLVGRSRSVSLVGDGVSIDIGNDVIRAGHLIVASNPHERVIPDWAWSLIGSTPGVLNYAAEVDLGCAQVQGQRIVVIGGGLTAAHLACGAASSGAHVHWVTREPIRYRSFDTDPGWLGPKCLDEFHREPDPAKRLERVRAARGGGSVPEWMRHHLRSHVGGGRLVMHEGSDVRAAMLGEDGPQLALGDNTTLVADRVWLATGTRPDIGSARCLAELVADLPVIEGYPVVGPDLRLGSHPIFVMGRLASLALGPAAGNLWGAQRGAERITRAITGICL